MSLIWPRSLPDHDNVMTSLDSSPESFMAYRDPFEAYIYSGPEVLVEDNLLEYWNYRIRPQPDLARFALYMLAKFAGVKRCVKR